MASLNCTSTGDSFSKSNPQLRALFAKPMSMMTHFPESARISSLLPALIIVLFGYCRGSGASICCRRLWPSCSPCLSYMFPSCVIERLPDEPPCVAKPLQTVDCQLNFPDSPMPDLRYVSGECHRGIEGFWVSLHPDAEAALLQMSTAEDSIFERPTYVLGFVRASYAARREILA
jgi:hypothetical protein